MDRSKSWVISHGRDDYAQFLADLNPSSMTRSTFAAARSLGGGGASTEGCDSLGETYQLSGPGALVVNETT